MTPRPGTSSRKQLPDFAYRVAARWQGVPGGPPICGQEFRGRSAQRSAYEPEDRIVRSYVLRLRTFSSTKKCPRTVTRE
eukprot:15437030-Alexandrium_andersonii.AAC.1